MFEEKIQEKDIETDDNNILSSDQSMSDIIPSEFDNTKTIDKKEDFSSDGSGNIMDEECKESIAEEGQLEVLSQEYGETNQTVFKGAELKK